MFNLFIQYFTAKFKKMKKEQNLLSGLIILGGIVISTQVFAQNSFTDGTTWCYNNTEFFDPGPLANSYYIEGDTLIQGKACKIFHRSKITCDYRFQDMEFLYEEGNQVYYYDEAPDTFNLLYDYDWSIDQIVTLPTWSGLDDYIGPEFHIRIDDVDWGQINNIPVRMIVVSYDTEDDGVISFSDSPLYKGVIIEKIGSLVNFFHFNEYGVCDISYNKELSYFESDTLGSVQFTALPCGEGSSSINSFADKNQLGIVDLRPNPAGETIFFKSTINFIDLQIEVFSIEGQQQRSIKSNITKDEPIQIPLNDLPSGLYMMVGKSPAGQVIFNERFIKQ